MGTVLTIIASSVGIVAIETIAILVYKVLKMERKVDELSKNLDTLATYTLELTKHVSGVDVFEEDEISELNFPNTEGF